VDLFCPKIVNENERTNTVHEKVIHKVVGGKLQLFCKPLIVEWLVRACKCAVMWNSQNGFAEKCAVG